MYAYVYRFSVSFRMALFGFVLVCLCCGWSTAIHRDSGDMLGRHALRYTAAAVLLSVFPKARDLSLFVNA